MCGVTCLKLDRWLLGVVRSWHESTPFKMMTWVKSKKVKSKMKRGLKKPSLDMVAQAYNPSTMYTEASLGYDEFWVIQKFNNF